MTTIGKKFLLLFIFSLTLSFVISPHNAKELFNLHHMSACNVVEQIFGILKQHFWILCNPPNYNMAIQALIPPVLAVLHNFIQQYDPEEIYKFDDTVVIELQMGPHESAGELGAGHVMPNDTLWSNERWDKIANEM